jgi:LPXTG-motif cell wall-anchored protein
LKGQKDADCDHDGYTGDKVCDACGVVVEPGTKIPATGHIFSDGKCIVCGADDPNYTPDVTTDPGVTTEPDPTSSTEPDQTSEPTTPSTTTEPSTPGPVTPNPQLTSPLPWILIGVGGILVIGLILFFVFKRKKDDDKEDANK